MVFDVFATAEKIESIAVSLFINLGMPSCVQYGEVDNLANGSKNLSCSKLIIVVQICAMCSSDEKC